MQDQYPFKTHNHHRIFFIGALFHFQAFQKPGSFAKSVPASFRLQNQFASKVIIMIAGSLFHFAVNK